MSAAIKHSMVFRVVTMTPTWAMELLSKNHPNNRKRKNNKINQFARDMRQGYWDLNHQAIAVDEDGFLVDGQNRLEACILYEVDFPTVLVTGVPRKGLRGVDLGTSRNIVDVAQISGNPLPFQANNYAGAARAMEAGIKGRCRLTHAELLQFIKVHTPALAFAFECMPRHERGITHAAVRALIARSYYRRQLRNRTRDFCEILYSGLVADRDEDVAAIRLRNWLQGNFLGGMRKQRARRIPTDVVYSGASYCLDMFHRKESINRVEHAKKELFPIAEDQNGEVEEEVEQPV